MIMSGRMCHNLGCSGNEVMGKPENPGDGSGNHMGFRTMGWGFKQQFLGYEP
jgi:hypothetical protein